MKRHRHVLSQLTNGRMLMVSLNGDHKTSLFKKKLTRSCRDNRSPKVSILVFVFWMSGHYDPSRPLIVPDRTVSIECAMNEYIVQSENEDGHCVHRCIASQDIYRRNVWNVSVSMFRTPTDWPRISSSTTNTSFSLLLLSSPVFFVLSVAPLLTFLDFFPPVPPMQVLFVWSVALLSAFFYPIPVIDHLSQAYMQSVTMPERRPGSSSVVLNLWGYFKPRQVGRIGNLVISTRSSQLCDGKMWLCCVQLWLLFQ